MTELDPRLGRITPEQVTYPVLTVNGKPYERYMSTLNIGGGYFVALDTWGAPDEQVLNELKAQITPKAKKDKHDHETKLVTGHAEQLGSSEAGGAL